MNKKKKIVNTTTPKLNLYSVISYLMSINHNLIYVELFFTKIKHLGNISNTGSSVPVPERMFKVIFAGDSAVGKTSWIVKYCKGTFVSTTSSTLGNY